MQPTSFALIGAAGYIAPRHLQAVQSLGGELVAALDPHDSVGVLDSYFPEARFFVEFERFDRHVDKLRRQDRAIDYVSVCSPNYLHDSHIRFGLRAGADVICEKPMVLNPWNIDAIQEIERETGRRVNTILQLRLHPSVVALRRRLDAAPADQLFDVDLTYITSRGSWYLSSWKGTVEKSGGIATNIGVHFFDLLHHLFGATRASQVHLNGATRAAGFLHLERARVRWFLSIDRADLPAEVSGRQPTYRSITVAGEELEFSGGFTELHKLSYRAVLDGRGFTSEDCRRSIETVAAVRKTRGAGLQGDYHPYLRRVQP